MERQYKSADELWNDMQLGLREGVCVVVYESDKARSRNVMLTCTLHGKLIPRIPPVYKTQKSWKWPAMIVWDLTNQRWTGIPFERVLSFSRIGHTPESK